MACLAKESKAHISGRPEPAKLEKAQSTYQLDKAVLLQRLTLVRCRAKPFQPDYSSRILAMGSAPEANMPGSPEKIVKRGMHPSRFRDSNTAADQPLMKPCWLRGVRTCKTTRAGPLAQRSFDNLIIVVVVMIVVVVVKVAITVFVVVAVVVEAGVRVRLRIRLKVRRRSASSELNTF